MKFDMLDKVMSAVKDYHLPICFAVFVVGAILQWFHHLDMAFVAYTGTVLGAITGHAYSPAQKDRDDPK
jgi:membrane protein YqaA with SNARE-associated domain